MTRIFTIGFSSLIAIASAACSLEPKLDQSGLPQNGVFPPTAGGGVVPPPGTPGAGVPYATAPFGCGLDTRQVVETQGRFFEIVTSRGRLFEFENGAPVQPGVGLPSYTFPQPGAIDLTTVPLYQQGPCAGQPAGACEFETHAFVVLPGTVHIREYVTAFGRQWIFENNTMTGAGIPLDAIPRYAEICQFRNLTGGVCTFDTRTFLKINGEVVESITAYGRLWQLDIDGFHFDESGLELARLPQYASGPCRVSTPGLCTFETRTFEPFNGQLIETITVSGLVFRYLPTGQEVPGSGVPIASAVHWANGPCQ